MERRNKSFIWGAIGATVFLIIGIALWISSSNFMNFVSLAALSISSFTLISCLILDNNFIGDMISEILDWGFIRMPGLIFTLDLDGIIWLLTVKLLFWIIGFILSFIFGILSILVGLFVSLFVYPFALRKSFKEPDIL